MNYTTWYWYSDFEKKKTWKGNFKRKNKRKEYSISERKCTYSKNNIWKLEYK